MSLWLSSGSRHVLQSFCGSVPTLVRAMVESTLVSIRPNETPQEQPRSMLMGPLVDPDGMFP